MRASITRIAVPLIACGFCSAAQATLVFDKTFTTNANGVVQFENGVGNQMLGPVSNNQLPVTVLDNSTNAFTPDKAGAPLGSTQTGANSFSALYNFNWSQLNTGGESAQAYEEAGFLGPVAPQTRQVAGIILRHWFISPADATAQTPSGYYMGLDLAFGSVGVTGFGYQAGANAIYLGPDFTPTHQIAIGYDGTAQTLTASLYDGSGNLLGTNTASVPTMFGKFTSASAAQSEISDLSVDHLGWSDYTGNGGDVAETWQMNSLSYYNDATGAFAAVPEPASLGLLAGVGLFTLSRRRRARSV